MAKNTKQLKSQVGMDWGLVL